MKNLFSFLFTPLLLGIDDPAGGGGGNPPPGGNPPGNLPPATDYRTYLNPDGGFAKHDWAGDEKDAAAKFKSLPDLWKSYRTLERINSNGNKIAIPGDTSTEAEWNAFYEKLGRPVSDDKYEVTVPDNVKALVSEEGLKEFRSMAFKSGLNGKQVKALTEYYFGTVTKAHATMEQAAQQAVQTAEADLSKDWGPKGGTKWKEQLALAQKGARAAGLPDEAFADPAIGNNPHFLRAMVKVAGMTAENPAANQRGDGGGGFGGDVTAQISAIMNDPKHPYHVKGHPDHKKAVEHMALLHQRKAAATT